MVRRSARSRRRKKTEEEQEEEGQEREEQQQEGDAGEEGGIPLLDTAAAVRESQQRLEQQDEAVGEKEEERQVQEEQQRRQARAQMLTRKASVSTTSTATTALAGATGSMLQGTPPRLHMPHPQQQQQQQQQGRRRQRGRGGDVRGTASASSAASSLSASSSSSGSSSATSTTSTSLSAASAAAASAPRSVERGHNSSSARGGDWSVPPPAKKDTLSSLFSPSLAASPFPATTVLSGCGAAAQPRRNNNNNNNHNNNIRARPSFGSRKSAGAGDPGALQMHRGAAHRNPHGQQQNNGPLGKSETASSPWLMGGTGGRRAELSVSTPLMSSLLSVANGYELPGGARGGRRSRRGGNGDGLEEDDDQDEEEENDDEYESDDYDDDGEHHEDGVRGNGNSRGRRRSGCSLVGSELDAEHQKDARLADADRAGPMSKRDSAVAAVRNAFAVRHPFASGIGLDTCASSASGWGKHNSFAMNGISSSSSSSSNSSSNSSGSNGSGRSSNSSSTTSESVTLSEAAAATAATFAMAMPSIGSAEHGATRVLSDGGGSGGRSAPSGSGGRSKNTITATKNRQVSNRYASPAMAPREGGDEHTRNMMDVSLNNSTYTPTVGELSNTEAVGQQQRQQQQQQQQQLLSSRRSTVAGRGANAGGSGPMPAPLPPLPPQARGGAAPAAAALGTASGSGPGPGSGNAPLQQQQLHQHAATGRPSVQGEESAITGTQAVPTPIIEAPSRKKCNCKRSQCLKLYCECFAAMQYCEGCNCKDCYNRPETEEKRQEAITATKERNSNAFRDKINAAAVHAHGCHCKKSACLKKYCECFEAGVVCGENCKCLDCLNFAGSADLEAVRQHRAQASSKKKRLPTPNRVFPSSVEAVVNARKASPATNVFRGPPTSRATNLHTQAQLQAQSQRTGIAGGLGAGVLPRGQGKHANDMDTAVAAAASAAAAAALACAPSATDSLLMPTTTAQSVVANAVPAYGQAAPQPQQKQLPKNGVHTHNTRNASRRQSATKESARNGAQQVGASGSKRARGATGGGSGDKRADVGTRAGTGGGGGSRRSAKRPRTAQSSGDSAATADSGPTLAVGAAMGAGAGVGDHTALSVQQTPQRALGRHGLDVNGADLAAPDSAAAAAAVAGIRFGPFTPDGLGHLMLGSAEAPNSLTMSMGSGQFDLTSPLYALAAGAGSAGAGAVGAAAVGAGPGGAGVHTGGAEGGSTGAGAGGADHVGAGAGGGTDPSATTAMAAAVAGYHRAAAGMTSSAQFARTAVGDFLPSPSPLRGLGSVLDIVEGRGQQHGGAGTGTLTGGSAGHALHGRSMTSGKAGADPFLSSMSFFGLAGSPAALPQRKRTPPPASQLGHADNDSGPSDEVVDALSRES